MGEEGKERQWKKRVRRDSGRRGEDREGRGEERVEG
jgi:hypothetical protein